ncbi:MULTISPECIES: molybdopterin adenylyltransferase [unclassified Campylobacter]|uniref:molybdopterin adenylyltransferase n=1 Tax=unclassified Campylobacter TaxID=2593542 RepID=UPI001BD9144D|nr:molybdopterin adenylyltransferase [Campylobacter sp. 2018MI13]MBZ7978465.1 molybdopterin adenylyltransferase [Campylobacter sp. RM12654]MBZ7984206.1 molybdopterin adenylyltransferase [Campylobacter sp. RM12647]MBZ7991792.1 molybdopterin adenylyltransferase [Campylobacter sp. RM9331]MBZ7993554.1 molybdopterin adenylyltransferase [Campylobacter sp. RM9333]MBZ8006098.1 molybdopterin adenylyltransferase [Campylobacter sp. RM9332]MBZ8008054.1 molybdopterin adenylyltransferase [Campylobacter sp.
MDIIKIGIITSSDRASAGVYEDISGAEIRKIMQEYLLNEIDFKYSLIPDEEELITNEIIKMSDEFECDLVFTTGGTGPALRDVTPEATKKAIERELPGFGELMRASSLKIVPTAILSRQLAGTRGKTLIINLPGKPKAIRECIEPIFPAIPYCLDLMNASYINESENAPKVFRPKSK